MGRMDENAENNIVLQSDIKKRIVDSVSFPPMDGSLVGQ